jgi:hypothetical protein
VFGGVWLFRLGACRVCCVVAVASLVAYSASCGSTSVVRMEGCDGCCRNISKTARQILHHHGRRIGQLRKQVIDSYPETQRQTSAEVRELAHLNSILLGPSNSLRSN